MSAPAADRRAALLAYCARGLDLAERAGYRSFDPFDGLDCPCGRALFRISKAGARIAVQVGARSGATPRRLAGVGMRTEAKAVADLLSTACVLEESGAGDPRRPERLVELLLGLAVPTEHGQGWGLSFPCASRFVRAEAMTPNAYTTACAAGALLDAAAVLRRDDLVAAATAALSFVTEDLGWIRRPEGDYLRYWPGLDAPITNVQALVASVAARTARASGEERWSETAQVLARSVVVAQRGDGSWRYSEDGSADFVDSFHTGFVLDGLRGFLTWAGTSVHEVRVALERGLEYFRAHLFDERSALPRARSDGRPTHDPQAVAQCAVTLSSDGSPAGLDGAWRTFGHFPELDEGRLVRPRGLSPASYLSLRWHVGPAVLAAARMLELAGHPAPTGGE
ncbi:MAG TPA: hypothetical protein VKU92_01055 [Acidimicrobiales bacterium]|nr:hypothetical protein [Acidimicrobiales bacterium]